MGWWCERQIRFCVFALKAEFGGKVKLLFGWELFAQIFARSRPSTCNSSMFFVAPDDARARAVAEEHAQGEPESSRMPLASALDWESALHVSKHARLQLHRQTALVQRGHAAADLQHLSTRDIRRLLQHELASDGTTSIFDLEQTRGFKPPSMSLPTLISHGTLVAATRAGEKLIIADEQLLSQGYPSFPNFSWQHPWGKVWNTFAETTKKDLVGNGIHGCVLMALVAYIIRVAVPSSLCQLGPVARPFAAAAECEDEEPPCKKSK